MKKDLFERISAKMVKDAGEGLSKTHSTTSHALLWKANWMEPLHSEYEKWRHVAHEVMGHAVVGPDANGQRIDRHKVAAAFAMAILKIEPLSVKTNQEKTPYSLWLVSEMLAVGVAIEIVRRMLLADKDAFHGKLGSELSIPATKEESYLLQTYKMLWLAKRDVANEKANETTLLMLANILFLLEAYNLSGESWLCHD